MAAEQSFPLRIDKLVAGGLGLGRHEGQVVFVPLAAPGDRLLVEPLERRRDFLRARTVEILEASAARREPPCRYFQSCGGCSLMHLRPEAQVEAKREILLESLRRVGGVSFGGEILVRSGPELGYRLRSRFQVKSTRRGPLVGFYEPGSHRVVDIDECLQISEEANRVLQAIRDFLAAGSRRASEVAAFELVEPVSREASKAEQRGRMVVHFLVNRGKGPSRTELEELMQRADLGGLVVSRIGPGTNVHEMRRIGAARPLHRVVGYEMEASVHAFFQANRFLLEALVEEVVGGDSSRMGSAVDLYSGVGLFSLPLARVADRVVAVEISSAAVADARRNARRAGIENVRFAHERADAYAVREGFEAVDRVVVDPPRAGLERAVVDALCAQPPKELRYVSCDPASLARDAGRLCGSGLELVRLVLFDFFPNTHHLESVATFRSA